MNLSLELENLKANTNPDVAPLAEATELLPRPKHYTMESLCKEGRPLLLWASH